MIEIVFKGHSKNTSKKLLRQAGEHYADKLMSNRLHENIHCTIILNNKNKDDHGTCLAYYEGASARVFDIEINNTLSQRQSLYALAHEMVHLKQLAKGEWYEYDRNPDQHRWNGTKIELNKDNNDEYWLAPWEIEAYGSEYGLYRSFKKLISKNDKK